MTDCSMVDHTTLGMGTCRASITPSHTRRHSPQFSIKLVPIWNRRGASPCREMSTRLAAIGEWRATVTEYDWEYVEHVQAGGGAPGGGHASGGALSLLFHRTLGPILTASMTDYQAIEISNQQAHRDYPHMTLTPRIECTTDVTYTSLSDFEASLAVTSSQSEISLDARGRLLTASYQPIPNGGVHYQLLYRLSPAKVEIVASADGKAPALLRFVLPVVSQHEELIEHPATNAVRIVKNKDRL